MVDRIHRHTADGRSDATPTLRASFAQLAEIVLVVSYLTDCCATVDVDSPHLSRAQAKRSVATLTSYDLDGAAGTSSKLTSLAWFHFDAVHERTDRDILQRKSIANLDRRVRTGLDRVAGFASPRRQDVTTLTVRVEDQC